MKFLLGSGGEEVAEHMYKHTCRYIEALRDKFANEYVSVKPVNKNFSEVGATMYWVVFEFIDKESELAFKLKYDWDDIHNYIRELHKIM